MRSATTSASPTRTWRRSRRRHVERAGESADALSATGSLAFGRAAAWCALVGPGSQRLAFANAAEGVHSRRHAAFMARREHAGAWRRAAGVADAPGLGLRGLRQQTE